MVMIQLDSIGVTLGRRPVVRNVSATMKAGTLVGIIGPNGAGKSSLLRVMLGLIPTSAGRVLIDSTPVEEMDRTTVARRIAYLPQGQTLHWPLSVERLVALGRLPHLAPMSSLAPDDLAAVERALARADVMDLRHRIATDLSGGERARALLARALAVEAHGLVVDEPLASLDPGHQIDVMTLLRREADTGALVVAVLHDLTMAARYCDQLLLMDGGALIADGAPMDVLTADRLQSVYGIHALIDGSGPSLMVVPMDRSIDAP
jgi:iron complex transport system ATP-binding protein